MKYLRISFIFSTFVAKILNNTKYTYMERLIIEELLQWKSSPRRKPLILNGARQVGKTWILKHFGQMYYDNVAYINCDKESLAAKLFEDYDVKRIIQAIEAMTNTQIIAGKTLIIIDEIQEVPRGLHALKYFAENAPEQHITVAGSLLGLLLHQGESFPVGKVNMLQMHPMTFLEFLKAIGEDKICEQLSNREWSATNTVHEKIVQHLRMYLYVGGMPEAVQAYCDNLPLREIRSIHNEILTAYINDLSKHAPKEQVLRITQVFRSIPAQIAKENKKFIFGLLKKGARAKDFELALQWLMDAGLVHKVCQVSKPEAPLTFYEESDAFKLFLLDCGLLGAMHMTDATEALLTDNIFEEYNGALTEQLVLQELKCLPNLPIYYYTKPNSQQEIDFVIDIKNRAIPVEAKAGENLQAKSLKQFIQENKSEMAIKTSLKPYKSNEVIDNVPLYALYCYLIRR